MVNIQNIICAYETEIISWVTEHYKELGYDNILEENSGKGPDLVMVKNGKKLKVEVEIYSSSFLKHNHNPKEVDEVLCVVNDTNLPIKTIKIGQLELWHNLKGNDLVDFFKQTPDTILINHKTHQTLYHFQNEWLNLSKEREMQIRNELERQAKLKDQL